MNKRGFTLVELLIAVFILSLVTALTYPAFINMLTASKGEASSGEAHLDKIVSSELIRLDLEHATYGIARDEPTVPLSWDGTNKTLQLKSTLNNADLSTIGWLLYDCTTGGTLAANAKVDKRQDTSNSNIVLLDSGKKFETLATTAGNCPASSDIYSAFPYNAGGTNMCSSQWCSGITYTISAANSLSTCAAGTGNLLRIVDGGVGEPVLNCVADFTVTFDLDTDGDGTVDITSTTSLPGTTAQILSQVKNIDMFVLMQAGRRDENLDTSENLTLDVTLSKAAVTEDPAKYRWKVVRISGKPMSW